MSGLPDCHVQACLYHLYVTRDTQRGWPTGLGLYSEQVGRDLEPKSYQSIYPSTRHPSIHHSPSIHPSSANHLSFIHHPPSTTIIHPSFPPSLQSTIHASIHHLYIHTCINHLFIQIFVECLLYARFLDRSRAHNNEQINR